MNRTDKINYYLDIAQTVAQRSTCLRRKYGAVIVKNDEIISTGYNGAPRGCTNCSDLGKCKREELNIPSGERYELCLAGDTVIKTPNGDIFIKDMVEKDEGIEIFAYDIVNNTYKKQKSFNAHMSGVRNDIVSVVLSTGKSIRCTSDHLFLKENNEYIPAKDLKKYDLIKSFIRKEEKGVMMNIPSICSVEAVIPLSISIPVYDITVPEYENFAIDAGDNINIIVHNCRSVHAEQNAIISASRRDMQGATLYLAGIDSKTNKVLGAAEPCSLCKRFILNSGITHVVMRNGKTHDIVETSIWRLLDII